MERKENNFIREKRFHKERKTTEDIPISPKKHTKYYTCTCSSLSSKSFKNKSRQTLDRCLTLRKYSRCHPLDCDQSNLIEGKYSFVKNITIKIVPYKYFNTNNLICIVFFQFCLFLQDFQNLCVQISSTLNETSLLLMFFTKK